MNDSVLRPVMVNVFAVAILTLNDYGSEVNDFDVVGDGRQVNEIYDDDIYLDLVIWTSDCVPATSVETGLGEETAMVVVCPVFV